MKFFQKYIWQSLQFYFRHSPLELRYANVGFSQFGEDVVLRNLLDKELGFYVDVGAYHPFNFSNTYSFYKRGWKGLNIEPNPYGYKLLEKYRKRDTNLQLGVSTVEGKLRFIPDSTYSRLVDPDEELGDDKSTIEVEVNPLSQILGDHLPEGTEIDFISVDCEGHDLKVLQSNDWTKYRPTFALVEEHRSAEHSEIIPYMESIGYVHLLRIGLTRLFVEKDRAALMS